MQLSRGNMGGKGVLGILAVAGIAIIGVPWIADKFNDQFDARTYGDTIGEVKEDFGEDAKVVTIGVNDGRISYEVIGDDGQVQVREYIRTSEDLPGAKTGYDNEVNNSTRALAAGEAEESTHTLAEFDENLVDDMYDEAGFGDKGSSAIFDGKVWALKNGANPFDGFEANADGSNVHQVSDKEDVFGPDAPSPTPSAGGNGSAVPQAPTVPPNVTALQECIQEAAGNVNKIQACASR